MIAQSTIQSAVSAGVRTNNQASSTAYVPCASACACAFTFIVLPPYRPVLFLIGRLVLWVTGRAMWAAFWLWSVFLVHYTGGSERKAKLGHRSAN